MSDLFLNELSTRLPASSIEEARERMERLVTTVQLAVEAGTTRRLRLTEPLDELILAPNYQFTDWRIDRAVDRELQTYWRARLAEHFPVAADDDNAARAEQHALSEFRYAGQPAVALGAAYLFDGFAVSISSAPDWATAHVPVEWSTLNDNVLTTNDITVRHASEPTHVDQHAAWLRPPPGAPQTLAEVWNRRTELFPALEFCPVVESQFVIAQAMNLFLPTLRRLNELNDLFANWRTGPLPMRPQMPGEPRPESKSTLNQYSVERTFVCVDGQPRVFSWHVSLNSGDRLQFFPDETRRICIIGYVGPHLPIASGS